MRAHRANFKAEEVVIIKFDISLTFWPYLQLCMQHRQNASRAFDKELGLLEHKLVLVLLVC